MLLRQEVLRGKKSWAPGALFVFANNKNNISRLIDIGKSPLKFERQGKVVFQFLFHKFVEEKGRPQ
jgi:hypothetical protein